MDECELAPGELHDEVNQLKTKVAVLENEHKNFREKLTDFVGRSEFAPVKMIAYGLIGTLGTSFVMGLISMLVLRKP